MIYLPIIILLLAISLPIISSLSKVKRGRIVFKNEYEIGDIVLYKEKEEDYWSGWNIEAIDFTNKTMYIKKNNDINMLRKNIPVRDFSKEDSKYDEGTIIKIKERDPYYLINVSCNIRVFENKQKDLVKEIDSFKESNIILSDLKRKHLD